MLVGLLYAVKLSKRNQPSKIGKLKSTFHGLPRLGFKNPLERLAFVVLKAQAALNAFDGLGYPLSVVLNRQTCERISSLGTHGENANTVSSRFAAVLRRYP